MSLRYMEGDHVAAWFEYFAEQLYMQSAWASKVHFYHKDIEKSPWL